MTIRTISDSLNNVEALAGPDARLKPGDRCLLDKRIILTFRGFTGFFAEVEGDKGMRFRVPVCRVTAVKGGE